MIVQFPKGPIPNLTLNSQLQHHLRDIAASGVPFQLSYPDSSRKDWKCPTYTSR
jgi:hypothetical protein